MLFSVKTGILKYLLCVLAVFTSDADFWLGKLKAIKEEERGK